MNDKKYEVKNDLKLKIFMTKETLKGYKPLLTQKELQKIVVSLYGLYYGKITIQEFASNMNSHERVFMNSKYHNDDLYFEREYLYHTFEYKNKIYLIASDCFGNVDCLSIYNLRNVLPQIYDYASSIDSELSLEGLCHILHNLNAKYSDIETVVRNHQIESLIRAYVLDGIIKDLIAKNEDIDKINYFINILNKEFGMNVIVPEVNAKARKRIKKI